MLGRKDIAVAGADGSGTDTAVLFASADLRQLSGVERIVLFGARAGLLPGERLSIG